MIKLIFLRDVFFAFFLLSPLFSFGQNIKGKVVDSENLPVPNVNIYFTSSEIHTHTNTNGEFEIHYHSEHDALIFKQFSYETKRIPLANINLSDSLLVTLNDEIHELSGVTIQKNINSTSITSEIDLKTNPVTSSQELLQAVPGLFIGQHAGGGKAEQIFLRGFDIDHGTDVNIAVDGMPVNMVSHAHGQGYSDLHFIIPETIEEIDFGKGSYYADKGNFATAGYIGFKTKDNLKQELTSVEVGQFNTRRITTMFNLTEGENHNAYAAIDYNASDGWFESPQNFKRLNLFTKYNHRSVNGTKTTITASHFTSRWDASGQIPVRAVESGLISRFGSIDDTEGGNTSRSNINLVTKKYLGDHTSIENRIFYTYYDFELYSNFTFFARDPVNSDQIRQKESRNMLGGESQLKHTYDFNGFDLHLTGAVGLRYDFVKNNELSYTKNRKTTLETVKLGDVQETNTYSYLNAEFDFGKWLINPALRLDYFNFSYTNKLDSVYRSPNETGLVASPKLNIVYQVSSKLQTYLKNGIGFHSNDSRVVVQQTANSTLPLAYSSDLGFVFKPAPSLLINAAVWQLFLEQEFVYVGDEGIVEPSGRTQRYGLDIGIRYELTKGLFLFTDFTYAHARSVEDPEGQNYIPLAPIFSNTGGVSYSPDKRISGSLRYRYIADRPANEDNSLTAEGYFVTDFNVNYQIRNWRLGIIIQNLFNTEWKETQFATESRLRNEPETVEEIHFTPGIPFALRGKLSYMF